MHAVLWQCMHAAHGMPHCGLRTLVVAGVQLSGGAVAVHSVRDARQDCRLRLPRNCAALHISVACRDNLRLKGQRLQDTSILTKQKKRIKALEERLAWSEQHGEDLNRQLRESKSQADESTAQVDSLKARIRELEAVEFVMTDRANRFADEVQPRREEVAQLTQQRTHQDTELARTLRLVGSLKTTGEQKDAGLRRAATLPQVPTLSAWRLGCLVGRIAGTQCVFHSPVSLRVTSDLCGKDVR